MLQAFTLLINGHDVALTEVSVSFTERGLVISCITLPLDNDDAARARQILSLCGCDGTGDRVDGADGVDVG
jgi:hypothetical protein